MSRLHTQYASTDRTPARTEGQPVRSSAATSRAPQDLRPQPHHHVAAPQPARRVAARPRPVRRGRDRRRPERLLHGHPDAHDARPAPGHHHTALAGGDAGVHQVPEGEPGLQGLWPLVEGPLVGPPGALVRLSSSSLEVVTPPPLEVGAPP
eukprot:CAMPEP_0185688790 /NCGR_PEP_ID=MMETSP1164-20130828/52_1 /TAXON_ID=1104430 /ORGANISM="Chrysoreinhardia sp, Strain CCMP2950" /LENGTH=150 /DNA_ID=CAMNT_0028355253 /DNA_START=10 /DNA_END=462 /DNA_ORIENTATION=-